MRLSFTLNMLSTAFMLKDAARSFARACCTPSDHKVRRSLPREYISHLHLGTSIGI